MYDLFKKINISSKGVKDAYDMHNYCKFTLINKGDAEGENKVTDPIMTLTERAMGKRSPFFLSLEQKCKRKEMVQLPWSPQFPKS